MNAVLSKRGEQGLAESGHHKTVPVEAGRWEEPERPPDPLLFRCRNWGSETWIYLIKAASW